MESDLFLAFPARFERAAFRLGGERSILLSYGNKAVDVHGRRIVPYSSNSDKEMGIGGYHRQRGNDKGSFS